MPKNMLRPLSDRERLAAVELAIEAIAARLDWKKDPPADVTRERLAAILPPTSLDELDVALLRVRARMYELLGAANR